MESESEKKYKEQILFSALDFFKRDFEVSNAEIAKILNVQTKDVRSWFSKRRVALGNDKNMGIRITFLIGIHWNLCAMFSTSKNRMIWLKAPHPELHNKMSPLEAISRPGGLSAMNSRTARLVSEGA